MTDLWTPLGELRFLALAEPKSHFKDTPPFYHATVLLTETAAELQYLEDAVREAAAGFELPFLWPGSLKFPGFIALSAKSRIQPTVTSFGAPAQGDRGRLLITPVAYDVPRYRGVTLVLKQVDAPPRDGWESVAHLCAG